MFVGDRVKVVCDHLMANGKIGIVEAILPDDFVSVRFGDGTYGSYKEFNLSVILMEDDTMEQEKIEVEYRRKENYKIGEKVMFEVSPQCSDFGKITKIIRKGGKTLYEVENERGARQFEARELAAEVVQTFSDGPGLEQQYAKQEKELAEAGEKAKEEVVGPVAERAATAISMPKFQPGEDEISEKDKIYLDMQLLNFKDIQKLGYVNEPGSIKPLPDNDLYKKGDIVKYIGINEKLAGSTGIFLEYSKQNISTVAVYFPARCDHKIYLPENEIIKAYYIDRLNEYLKSGEVKK